MQADNEKRSQSNVVSIFSAREKDATQAPTDSRLPEHEAGDDSFEQEISRYKQAQERLKRDRAKTNRSVLRSYRIKF